MYVVGYKILGELPELKLGLGHLDQCRFHERGLPHSVHTIWRIRLCKRVLLLQFH